jgi:anthranilate phosphoribosyltransferase
MGIAAYLEFIGRGVGGAPPLSVHAAHNVMSQVLGGHASATEVGAFLMGMRMRSQALDELVGFLAAAQERCPPVHSLEPVVLIPSYNGSRTLPNLTPLLASWLAREGLRVLIHGPRADPGRVTSATILQDLGIAPALQPADVDRAWERREPAYVPIGLLCPPLQSLLDLRALIGLRGPGHAVAKMLNPIVGAPALRLVHHTQPEVGVLLSAWVQRENIDAMLLRGTDGEPVADPRLPPRIETWIGGRLRQDLSVTAQPGARSEPPLLPRGTDAAGTAVYVQEVLSGMRPAPPSLARQAALIAAAVLALRTRRTALEAAA